MGRLVGCGVNGLCLGTYFYDNFLFKFQSSITVCVDSLNRLDSYLILSVMVFCIGREISPKH